MSKNDLSRRNFVKMTSLAGLGFFGFQMLSCTPNKTPASTTLGFGPLLKDPNGLFDLPKGFSYKFIAESGTEMSDGFLVPGSPDGMGAFAGENGRVILICNHEIHPRHEKHSPYGKNNENLSKVLREKVYDICNNKQPCTGGTTTLIYNPKTGDVEKQFLSLTGTINNCSGGVTPWGSWISSEEYDEGDRKKMDEGNFLTKDHGYNFEVPASATALVDPVPLKAMGRFNHEAVAVDPNTGICYQTEDQSNGLFYRFIPTVLGDFKQGGKLQALALAEVVEKDIRNWNKATAVAVGEKMAVRWIDLDDVEAKKEELQAQGKRKGALEFARGEGMWFVDGSVYFCCTNGGAEKFGQVMRYTPSSAEGTEAELTDAGTIEIFVESHDQKLMKACDNITLAPNGDLIVCEDAGLGSCLNGITPDGQIYKIAKNVAYDSEFTGGVFSPDGSTFFVNAQSAGKTLAIKGPWMERA
jgi:hypothetical protein